MFIKNIVVLRLGWKTVKIGWSLHIWWKVCAIFSSFMTRGYQLVIKYEGRCPPLMNGEEMLQVFIFHPYCMELQGKAIKSWDILFHFGTICPILLLCNPSVPFVLIIQLLAGLELSILLPMRDCDKITEYRYLFSIYWENCTVLVVGNNSLRSSHEALQPVGYSTTLPEFWGVKEWIPNMRQSSQ